MTDNEQPNDPFSPDSTDELAKELGAYDPNAYYVRAYNKKGFGARVRLDWTADFPREVTALVAQLVQSDQFPEYRTVADFYRDAAVHHIHRRTRDLADRKANSIVNSFMVLERVKRLEAEGIAIRETVDKYADMLQYERDPQKIRAIVESAKSDLQYLDSEYYRQELQRIIDRYDYRP